MLLKANKYRKDKKADCRQNELGSRIFMGRVFGDYAECLHFYPSFSYGRIIAGEKVRVPVMLENNPGFADLSIEIDYDSAVVELTDVQPNNEVGGNFTPAQNYTVRPYVLNWVNDENNNLFNGVLAILTFTIKQDAPLGSYPITVDYYRGITGNNIDGEDVNYDKDWNRVPLNYLSGKLIVCAYTPGDINSDGEVDINDAICLLKYVAGWKLDGVVIEALDVNGDGRVNTKDAIQILRYIAGRNVTLY